MPCAISLRSGGWAAMKASNREALAALAHGTRRMGLYGVIG